tara:strand:+ start:13878 stop:14276 length:399 start_codon:yes stop_codon:yes gene_type:complete
MIKYIIILLILIFNKSVYSEENKYEAIYEPLVCKGVASEYQKLSLADWKFYPTGGSGSEIDIRYNKKKKRVGKIRTTVYANGNLYGRGKWIGRTSSRIYNTLVQIDYDSKTKDFILNSEFNADDFHLMGKCN